VLDYKKKVHFNNCKVDEILTHFLLWQLPRLLFAMSKQSFENLNHSSYKHDHMG